MKEIAAVVLLLAFVCWGFYQQGKVVGVSEAMYTTAKEYESR